MISSIDDSFKKTDMSIEQMIETLEKDSVTDIYIKEENMSGQDHELLEEKIENNRNLCNGVNAQPVIPHPVNAISYPALHNSANVFFNQGIFSQRNAILAVSSLCSFNSVTNFISWFQFYWPFQTI